MRLFIILSTLIVCSKASITRSPYIVAILNKGSFNCAGSIIHKQFILTSASCVSGTNLSDISIRAGSDKHNTGGVIAPVGKINTHPKYNEFTLDYNIAVLEINGCLAIPRSTMQAIPISRQTNSVEGGFLSGWTLNRDSIGPLEHYQVNLLSFLECKLITAANITSTMLCAEITKRERCLNFSPGSPLVADGRLVGILSLGFQCDQNLPEIFTNISVLINFINEIKRFA